MNQNNIQKIQNMRLALSYWVFCAGFLKQIARKSINQMKVNANANLLNNITNAEKQKLLLELGKNFLYSRIEI